MSVHMRRIDKQISDTEKMKDILQSVKYITIALCKDNTPYLATLSHGYERKHNCIYFHCASQGKKIEFMKANNHVWGQALNDLGYAAGQCNHLFETVQFSGTVTFLEKLEEKREALECMIRHLEKDPQPVIARIKNERLASTTFGRINIEQMTGKQPERTKQQ